VAASGTIGKLEEVEKTNLYIFVETMAYMKAEMKAQMPAK